MEEKTIGYVLSCLRKTDICGQGLSAVFSALRRQHKINKMQKLVNSLLFAVATSALINVIDLKQTIRSQAEKIATLLEKNEVPKNTEGE